MRLRSIHAVALAIAVTAPAAAGTLVIDANIYRDVAPRLAFEQLIADFEREHPDVEVKLNRHDHERFKSLIYTLMTSEWSDVVTWFPGERMRFFVKQGLFEDVSDIWEEHGLKEAMASSLPLVSVAGRQYGMPYTYYHWGIYYRKDIFAKHGLDVPETWDEFLAVCKTLKDNGITPINIGTKPLWPAASWFDYLNLRLNGLDFHLDLTAGKVSFTDARVRQVFEYWRELIDRGYFIDNHQSYTWQEALPLLIEGKTAMFLLGNFVAPVLKKAGVVDKIGFFQFPVIDPNVPLYEEAPIDTVHIPSTARNKEDARQFLAFIARPDQQAKMNRILGQLPTNKNAAAPDEPFLDAAQAMLSEAAGLSQFYDRDTYYEMALNGMAAFQRFMEEPDELDAILNRLEVSRKLIYEVLDRAHR